MRQPTFSILAILSMLGLAGVLAPAGARAQETAPPPADDDTATEPTAAPAPAPMAQPAPQPAPASRPAAPAEEQSAAAGTMATNIAEPPVSQPPLPPVGKIGIGYFTTAAPLGVRYWVDESLGFDGGLGFNIADAGGDGSDTTYGTALEAGVLYALARLTNIIVFVRGGIGLDLSNLDGQGGVDVGFNINGLIGGEFFLTALGFPNLSFSGGVGLQIDLNAPDGGDFGFQLASANAPVDIVSAAVLGFHIYF